MTDVVVYRLGSTAYLARFDDGAWVAWPAEADGWRQRKRGREQDAQPDLVLEPTLAALALRLSGVVEGAG